jgi:4-aminobutyrate aminotransferase/(S)-3-amino-2-methylpropionate transaminase
MAGALRELAREIPAIGEVRNLGAMVAMELVKNRDPHAPDADLTKALTKRAAEKGLVLLSCGIYGNVIRFLVPLTASDAIVREGLGIVADALRELTGIAVRAAANA